MSNLDTGRLQHLANVLRGLIFATVEAGQSGHPGGSSSKVEQILALLFGGVLAFDSLNPKNPGRDRVVWSAGHCTPGLYSALSLIYDSWERSGKKIDKKIHPVFSRDLANFRRAGGLQGHTESYSPLADYSTGPSGHGLSAAGAFALMHRSCGLPTKVWVLMGDAESEEGMTYEARNILATNGADNLIVLLDYNHFGIDGPIEEVVSTDYTKHWSALGWNVLEVDGHNVTELIKTYRAAESLKNGRPTVVIAHTIKGKEYGIKENTADSHGSPISHEEYVKAVMKLGFNIPGKIGEVKKDLEVIIDSLDKDDVEYIVSAMKENAKRIKKEKDLVKTMKKFLGDRPLVDPLKISRPKKLPPELIFKPGEKVSTRKAAGLWMEWFMKQTAFFYVGAGDVSKSVLTGGAEKVYGLISKNNPGGRGFRFGIAEQNMAMMATGLTADTLPGGFKPISMFGTFAVFSSMMSNAVRLAVINNYINPANKGFFVLLASHDGPETGEDGPTHQGLYWMSYFQALPGIKVYKPIDANETIEMLFTALEKGEPIAMSLTRTEVPVLNRENSEPKMSIQGAYIYKDFSGNGNAKKVLCVAGSYVLQNVLSLLPELEKVYDTKIVVVTSPELFEELKKENPKAAKKIFSEEDRKTTVVLHNGWAGFMYPFLLPENYPARAIGINTYLQSGKTDELYKMAKLDSESLKKRILSV